MIVVHPGPGKMGVPGKVLVPTPEGKQYAAALAHANAGGSLSDDPADEWASRDLPVLRMMARAEQLSRGLDVDEIKEHLGIGHRQIVAAVLRLKSTGHLVASAYGSAAWINIRLTESGLRAVGVWPTEESALERLIAALQVVADDETRPEKERSKARKFGKWLAGSAQSVGLEVAGAVISGQLPGQ